MISVERARSQSLRFHEGYEQECQRVSQAIDEASDKGKFSIRIDSLVNMLAIKDKLYEMGYSVNMVDKERAPGQKVYLYIAWK